MSAGARASGRVIATAALVIATVLAVALMWVFGVGFFSKTTAETRGQTEARERTVADGAYRIAAYEQFFDLCTAVQNQEATIAALDLELATSPSASRVEQINATLTALRANRGALINEYNADARKEATVAQFHASNLPAELNTSTKETSCVASSD